MGATLHLIYDGKVFHPEEPVELQPDTRVRVTIEATEPVSPTPPSFLRTARTLALDGPLDWSARVEEYLYRGSTDDDE